MSGSRVVRLRNPTDNTAVDGMHPVAACAARAIAAGAAGCVILFTTGDSSGWESTSEITAQEGHWIAAQFAAACIAAAAADEEDE